MRGRYSTHLRVEFKCSEKWGTKVLQISKKKNHKHSKNKIWNKGHNQAKSKKE